MAQPNVKPNYEGFMRSAHCPMCGRGRDLVAEHVEKIIEAKAEMLDRLAAAYLKETCIPASEAMLMIEHGPRGDVRMWLDRRENWKG
jgi:hypothetical protein